MRVRIRCINKADRMNPGERIQNVGGTNQMALGGSSRSRQQIEGVESGKWAFYIERPQGDVVDVIVTVSQNKNKYLKTESDGDQPNNLLSLPECP